MVRLFLKTRASPFRQTWTTGPTAILLPRQIPVHRRQPQLQARLGLTPVGAHPVSDIHRSQIGPIALKTSRSG
jgi:hypothetical protein